MSFHNNYKGRRVFLASNETPYCNALSANGAYLTHYSSQILNIRQSFISYDNTLPQKFSV